MEGFTRLLGIANLDTGSMVAFKRCFDLERIAAVEDIWRIRLMFRLHMPPL
jgi:hypothetical protein